MQKLKGKLTYANVMASIAVFLVLGGGAAVAAGGLGKNSVGAKQLKKGAVTAAKIQDGAVSPAKLSQAAKTTLAGPQGPKGEAGSAKLWAEVSSTPTVLRSSGALSVRLQSKGYYCINAGQLTTSNAVALATPNYSDENTSSGDQLAVIASPDFNNCATGEFGVRTYDEAGGFDPAGFIFVIP